MSLENAEQLIKGAFYFMLKAKGGKYLSRKQVAGKDGKNKWVYTYANAKGKKDTKEKQVKQSKPKADNKSMNTPERKKLGQLFEKVRKFHDAPIHVEGIDNVNNAIYGKEELSPTDMKKITDHLTHISDVENYRKALSNKSPKYILGKIQTSLDPESLKILEALHNEPEKLKAVEKEFGGRLKEGDLVTTARAAFRTGGKKNENALKKVLNTMKRKIETGLTV